MKETLVFIDKGFLDVLSRYFGNGSPLKYDLIKLSKKISNEQGLICNKIFIYLAPPFQSNKPNEKEKKKKENYDRFKCKLETFDIVKLREGRVQRIIEKDGKEVFRQKGVDNLLTKDLCFVQRDFPKLNTIILISSDSDFAPIIEELRDSGLNIILYNYFERKRGSNFSISNHLINSVSKWVQLNKKHFEDSKLE